MLHRTPDPLCTYRGPAGQEGWLGRRAGWAGGPAGHKTKFTQGTDWTELKPDPGDVI